MKLVLFPDFMAFRGLGTVFFYFVENCSTFNPFLADMKQSQTDILRSCYSYQEAESAKSMNQGQHIIFWTLLHDRQKTHKNNNHDQFMVAKVQHELLLSLPGNAGIDSIRREYKSKTMLVIQMNEVAKGRRNDKGVVPKWSRTNEKCRTIATYKRPKEPTGFAPS